MIAPDIRMAGLDADLVAFVNAVLSRRDGRSERTVTVLHHGGRVVRVAVPDGWEAPPAGSPVGDPTELARRLVAEGAQLAVVLDEAAFDDLSRQLVELARACPSQGELLWRAREAWNHHPGVVQEPPPEPSKWREVSALLGRIGDDRWVMARIRRDAGPDWTVAGRVRAGLLVEVTSALPPGARAEIALELDTDALARVLTANDPMTVLREEASWRL